MGKLKITQVRSAVDRPVKQRGTIRALGLKRLHRPVVHEDRPQIRGMISVVEHLVDVEEISE